MCGDARVEFYNAAAITTGSKPTSCAKVAKPGPDTGHGSNAPNILSQSKLPSSHVYPHTQREITFGLLGALCLKPMGRTEG
jgi:hypothetical protein